MSCLCAKLKLMQTEFQIPCPYCFEPIWQEFYYEDGRSQNCIIDCEVCCQPIQFLVHFNSEGEGTVEAQRA